MNLKKDDILYCIEVFEYDGVVECEINSSYCIVQVDTGDFTVSIKPTDDTEHYDNIWLRYDDYSCETNEYEYEEFEDLWSYFETKLDRVRKKIKQYAKSR